MSHAHAPAAAETASLVGPSSPYAPSRASAPPTHRHGRVVRAVAAVVVAVVVVVVLASGVGRRGGGAGGEGDAKRQRTPAVAPAKLPTTFAGIDYPGDGDDAGGGNNDDDHDEDEDLDVVLKEDATTADTREDLLHETPNANPARDEDEDDDDDAAGDEMPTGDHEEAVLFEAKAEEWNARMAEAYPELANITAPMEREAALCAPKYVERTAPNSIERELKMADCGLGYDYKRAAEEGKKRRWRVALVGEQWDHPIVKFSGCPSDGVCVNAPRCRIGVSRSGERINDANVVVIMQKEPDLINHISVPPTATRVLYYRESKWHYPPFAVQKKYYDFEMGVHTTSGVLNPHFFKTPSQLLSGTVFPFDHIAFVPVNKRSHFAMSVISDCNAPSRRQIYIDFLEAYLGENRVHQYGGCGNKQLPPKPFRNAAKVIATYKFYLAFENTIQDGYVTEKLWTTLVLPVVPVFYGARNVMNITKTPSFIRAADFASPKELAEYLLFLDANPKEYMRYHAWRKDPSSFTPEFLEVMKHRVPGPLELQEYRKRGYEKFPRTASCCRLCDPEYVEYAKRSRRVPQDLVGPPLTDREIDRLFFAGRMRQPPKGGGAWGLLQQQQQQRQPASTSGSASTSTSTTTKGVVEVPP